MITSNDRKIYESCHGEKDKYQCSTLPAVATINLLQCSGYKIQDFMQTKKSKVNWFHSKV